MISKSQQRSLLLIILLSGVTALGYQVLWMRIFGLLFGVAVYAVSTVLTAFMAGLALGSYLFGRWADRKNPLMLFMIIETGIALFALIFPWLFDLLTLTYSGIFTLLPQDIYLKNGIRFLFSFLFLLVPTTLMGGTLPVAGKILVTARENLGSRIGSIYALNNLGAVVGCFIAGFILMHTIGLRSTMVAAAVINIGNALALNYLYKRTTLATNARQESGTAGESRYSNRLLSIVLIVFAVEGLCALGYEVIWTRILLGFSYDKSSYFMTTVIISFIFGLAFGSFLITGIVDRTKKPMMLFGWIEVGIGLSALAILPVFPLLIKYLDHLRPLYSESWWRHMGYEYLLFFLIMLIPTTIMGMAYPVVSKIFITHLSQIGIRLGRIGYLDTIGSILGAFIAGFLFIPLYGVVQSNLILAVVNIALGLGLIMLSPDITNPGRWKRLSAVAIAGCIAYYGVPAHKYFEYWQTAQPADRLLFYQEGAGATVAVPQHLDGVTELAINGAVTAFAEYNDIRVHKLLAYLPYLLQENSKRALVIGLGMGVTVNALVKTDSLMVDCVEISPEVCRAAAVCFTDINANIMQKKGFNLILDDGRSHLQIAAHNYDIISSNAVNARLSSNLYTTEFYRLCKAKLSTTGIMCQWLSTNWVLETEYKMLLRSFVEVFPHTSLWCVDAGHLLLIGAPQPLQIDYKSFSKVIQQDSIYQDLIDYGLADASTILAFYVASTPAIQDYISNVPDNTDNLPIVEMSKVVSMARNPEIIASFFMQKQAIEEIIIPGTLGRGDSLDLTNHFQAEKLLIDATLKSRYQKQPVEALQSLLQAAKLTPNNYVLHKNLAILYYAGANFHQAVKSLVRAINIHPKIPAEHEHLGIILFEAGSYQDAQHAFENALLLDSQRPLSRYYRAAIYKMMGNILMAKSELKETIKIFPNYIEPYYSLALIYEEQKDYSQALDYYRHCLGLNSSYKNVAQKIQELTN